jgi:hypothetical protein
MGLIALVLVPLTDMFVACHRVNLVSCHSDASVIGMTPNCF